MIQISLKTLRENAGLSQAKLAKLLGVSQSTVGMWESGKNKPEFANLEKLSKIFNVSPDYLIGINAPNGYKKETPDLNPELTEVEKEIIKNYQLSSEDGKLLLRKIAMYIAHAASTGYPDQRIPAKQRVIESLARQAGLQSKNQEADAE